MQGGPQLGFARESKTMTHREHATTQTRSHLPWRWLRRHVVTVVTSVAILAVGGLALDAALDGQRSVERNLREDRARDEQTAARSVDNGLLPSFRGSFDAAQSHPWSLAADDPGDIAALTASVRQFQSFGYVGGMVLDLRLQPTATYTVGPPLPPLADPGYSPMLAGLGAGKAGPSAVLVTSGTPLAGFPAPIIAPGRAGAAGLHRPARRPHPIGVPGFGGVPDERPRSHRGHPGRAGPGRGRHPERPPREALACGPDPR